MSRVFSEALIGYAEARVDSVTDRKRRDQMRGSSESFEAAEAKLEGLKALKAPTEGLYQVLSDEQKKKADALLGSGCGMM